MMDSFQGVYAIQTARLPRPELCVWRERLMRQLPKTQGCMTHCRNAGMFLASPDTEHLNKFMPLGFFSSCYIISACFLSIVNVAGVVGCRCLKTWPLSSNSLFLVQSCICMNTQYYYSRHGEHTAASGFHQFSHCKKVKTKAQG